MSAPSATETSLEVAIRGLVPQPYLGKRLRARVGDVGGAVQRGYAELFAKLAAAGVTPAGPPFLVASPPQPESIDIELGVPCATPPAAGDLYAGVLPGGRGAVTTHRGPYDRIAPVYEALSRWILTNRFAIAGPPREVYLTGPEDVTSPDEHVTEIIWPIA